MSDGSNTWGRSPEQAIGAAKQAEIPVSTIAFGTDDGFIELEGDRVAVPVNHEQLQGIAEGTGGSYYAAASAEELSSVYRDLGSQIGYTIERREVTTWFVGIGLLLAFAAAGCRWCGPTGCCDRRRLVPVERPRPPARVRGAL